MQTHLVWTSWTHNLHLSFSNPKGGNAPGSLSHQCTANTSAIMRVRLRWEQHGSQNSSIRTQVSMAVMSQASSREEELQCIYLQLVPQGKKNNLWNFGTTLTSEAYFRDGGNISVHNKLAEQA